MFHSAYVHVHCTDVYVCIHPYVVGSAVYCGMVEHLRHSWMLMLDSLLHMYMY